MNFATHLALLPILSRLYPYFYPLFNMQITLFLIKITLHCFWGFLCVIFTFPFIFWLFFENTFWPCHRGEWESPELGLLSFALQQRRMKTRIAFPKGGVAQPPQKVNDCWLWECFLVSFSSFLVSVARFELQKYFPPELPHFAHVNYKVLPNF